MSIARSVLVLLALAGLGGLAAPAAAQVALGGSVFDGSGGPLLAGTVYHTGGFAVPAGQTLTVQAGAIVKCGGGLIVVDGTLDVDGAVGNEAIFTSIQDDAAGGDTNGDGPSAGGPGQWQGIAFNTGSAASTIDHAVIRHFGAFGWAGVAINQAGADITVTNTTIAGGGAPAVDLNGHAAYPSVSGCHFSGNASVAVQEARLDSVPGFTSNTASGNAGGNFISVSNPTPAFDVTITTANCLGGALVVGGGNGSVPAGVTLRLEAGSVLKMLGNLLVVDGTLEMAGTAGEPVVVTGFGDDDFGGDTNLDGPSSGVPGQWQGIAFNAGSAASTIDHAVLRYAGAFGWSGISINQAGADISVTNTTVADGTAHGVDLNGHAAYPSVSGCHFSGNASVAVQEARLDSVPGFTSNTASGNAGGNFISVSNPTPAFDVTITTANCLGGALVVGGGNGSVPAGVTLRLEAGSVLKMLGNLLVVDGTLEMAGTAGEPVVVTAYTDDDFGGDTNLDGPSAGVPGSWQGIAVQGAASGSLEHALLRYSGAFGWPALQSGSATLEARRLRAERAAAHGYRLSAAAVAEDLTAFACSTGIELQGGAFTLDRATVAGSGSAGVVRSGAGFSGQVRGVVSWGNGGAGFTGFDADTVHYSTGTGIPGGTGNGSADPLFVDAASGDLRLQAASPCIDAGDPADHPTGQDQATFPRLMDGDLDTVRRVDKGAYEFSNLELAILGDTFPGGSFTVDTTAHTGFADAYLVLGLGWAETELPKYGNLFVDLMAPNFVLAWPAPPNVVSLVVPAGVPLGTSFVMQIGARVAAMPGVAGNVSNPVVVTVE